MTPIAATEGVLSLRDYNNSTDRAYVLKTWLMQAANGADKDRTRLYAAQDLLALHHLRNARVAVACLTDSPDAIVGFCAFSPGDERVLGLFVREAWRGKGVNDALYSAAMTWA